MSEYYMGVTIGVVLGICATLAVQAFMRVIGA